MLCLSGQKFFDPTNQSYNYFYLLVFRNLGKVLQQPCAEKQTSLIYGRDKPPFALLTQSESVAFNNPRHEKDTIDTWWYKI